MKASEAKRLSEEKAISIEKIYEEITMGAKTGNRQALFIQHIPMDVVAQLMKDGYQLSECIDSIGYKQTKIEW